LRPGLPGETGHREKEEQSQDDGDAMTEKTALSGWVSFAQKGLFRPVTNHRV
jgi:hypothetical protein